MLGVSAGQEPSRSMHANYFVGQAVLYRPAYWACEGMLRRAHTSDMDFHLHNVFRAAAGAGEFQIAILRFHAHTV